MGTDYSRSGQPLPADQLDAAFASWARADEHLIASVEQALDAGVELDLIGTVGSTIPFGSCWSMTFSHQLVDDARSSGC
ncbi:hypothetical protein [Nocardia asiatica]|uniref:hypothetical protein n=1 Tax=Nocardia asiatica TaxID=209252 RepID=UPI002455B4C7|nr:hypothetical protein [Nocardia asiatica]